MEEIKQDEPTSEWFKQLTHCGVSLKNFDYYNRAPDLQAEELLLLDSFNTIVEAFIEDDGQDRIDKVLEKLESFSLSTFAGYIQSVKHHSSYGHDLYAKEWTLCYILLGQLKLINKKHPDVVKLICNLSFNNLNVLNDYKFFVFAKAVEKSKASQTVKIDYDAYSKSSAALQRAREKIKNNSYAQERYKEYLKAQKLCNEVIEKYNESDDFKKFRKRGMTITGNLEELNLIKIVAGLIQEKIECTLILEEEGGDYKEVIEYIPAGASGSSSQKIDTTRLTPEESQKRARTLFERVVKEFTEIEDKTKILKNGLVVVARPGDFPLLMSVKDEISQIIKCEVFIREKKYDSNDTHAGDTLVSIKF